MSLLALDLATRTGWAVVVPPYRLPLTDLEISARGPTPQPLSGMYDLSIISDHARRFLSFESWLCLKIIKHDIDKIAVEEPISNHKSFAATKMAIGLFTIVIKEADRLNIPTWHVHNSTLKSWAIGAHRKSFKRGTKPKGYDKKLMMERGMARGWSFVDDNECDALWLSEYGCQYFVGLTPEKIAEATRA